MTPNEQLARECTEKIELMIATDSDIMAGCAAQYAIDKETMTAHILAALNAATEQQKRDGERLDWLLGRITVEEFQRILPKLSGKTIGEAIDAAMSKEART